jgi:hypothetical protein
VKLLRLRTLEAPPNPLHEAYTAATGRTVQDAVGNSPGVIDHTNPTLTDLARG